MTGGDEDGAADGLEEEDNGADGGEVGGFDDGLADYDRDLEDEAEADADELGRNVSLVLWFQGKLVGVELTAW